MTKMIHSYFSTTEPCPENVTGNTEASEVQQHYFTLMMDLLISHNWSET